MTELMNYYCCLFLHSVRKATSWENLHISTLQLHAAIWHVWQLKRIANALTVCCSCTCMHPAIASKEDLTLKVRNLSGYRLGPVKTVDGTCLLERVFVESLGRVSRSWRSSSI